MADLQYAQIINDIRKAMKTFIQHNDIIVRPTGIYKFVVDKRLASQIEKEVMVGIRKKNSDIRCEVDAIDNIYNYCVSRYWGTMVSLFDGSSGTDELVFCAFFSVIPDTIIYYIPSDGMYIARPSRIEFLKQNAVPSAIGVINVGLQNDGKLISHISTHPDLDKVHQLTCTGSFYADVVDLLLGKIACMFLSAKEYKDNPVVKILMKNGYRAAVVNGIMSLVNLNAKSCSDEESEDD